MASSAGDRILRTLPTTGAPGGGEETGTDTHQEAPRMRKGGWKMVSVPGPSDPRGVLAGLPHTTGIGFQTGNPDRRVLVV